MRQLTASETEHVAGMVTTTVNLPLGTTVSLASQANGSTTATVHLPNGTTSVWNSGTFLTCTLLSTGVGTGVWAFTGGNAILGSAAQFFSNMGCSYVMNNVLDAAGVNSYGGFCCFPKGTKITCADGNEVPIELIPIGSELNSFDGINNVEKLIKCTLKQGDKIYSINAEVECTWEQLFLGENLNWLAVDVEGYKSYRDFKRLENPEFGLEDNEFRQMEIGDVVYFKKGLKAIRELSYKLVDSPTILHSFVVNGDKTFIANGYVVENSINNIILKK